MLSKIIDKFVRFFCVLLSCFLPRTTIFVDGKPYLTRYYLLLREWKRFNVYLHLFHSSDQGDEMHSHPWEWSYGFILAGGYIEERRYRFGLLIETKRVLPGSINRIGKDDFHRVDLLAHNCWTVFVRGPRTPTWEFWDRHTGEYRDWSTNPEAIA